MNEDMTLKLFDNNLWAPNNIVAFDKNVVDAMNKKMLRACSTHIIKQSCMAPNIIETASMNKNKTQKLLHIDCHVWALYNFVASFFSKLESMLC